MVEWLNSLKLRLKTLVRRRQLEADLDDEMAFHRAMREADGPQKARGRFGNVAGLKEQCREQWTFPLTENLLADIRYAMRRTRKAPAFSIVAILIMGLGIGSNTAIFGLLDAVMMKALPVNDPESLVLMRSGPRREIFSGPVWEQIVEHQNVFAGMLAYHPQTFNIASGGETQFVNALFVNGSYFDVLGVKAEVGRILTQGDDLQGNSAVRQAVVSYGFWQSQYGGDREVIGTRINLDDHPFTIVGVAEPGFFGVRVGSSFDIAVPLSSAPIVTGNPDILRGPSWLWVMGRLKPGVSIEQAQAAVTVLQPAIREATMPPGADANVAKNYLNDPFRLFPGATGSSLLRDRYAQALFVLMIVVGLVLLIACANIGSLLLSRAETRRREINIRVAIGASRVRLIRQLLIESIILGLSGAIVGLAFATWSSHLLVRQLSTASNRVFLDLSLDWRILFFAISVGFLTSVLFGLMPAVRATRRTPNESLLAGLAGTSPGSVGMGRWLVSLQAGLSLVLIFGAVLFLRSYWILLTLNPGFSTSQVLLVNTDFRGVAAKGSERILSPSFYDTIVEALRAIPGVRSVAYSLTTPVAGASEAHNIEVAGYEPQSETDSLAFTNGISHDYFETVGTRLMSGRDFSALDRQNGNQIAIVNEAFAKKFFSRQDPIGKVFNIPGWRGRTDFQIVGLVQDAKYHNIREAIPPTFYGPVVSVSGPIRLVFSIKTSVPPMSIASAVTAAMGRIDKNISFTSRPFQSQIDDSLVQERLMAILSAFFGFLALVIAAVGLAGLVSYSVSRRRTEMGIRAALGATPGSLMRLVMWDVLVITAAGLVLGVVLSFAAGRLIARMLYQVSASDPITLIIGVSTLALAAVLAGYVPARRAARIDPMQCLRSE